MKEFLKDHSTKVIDNTYLVALLTHELVARILLNLMVVGSFIRLSPLFIEPILRTLDKEVFIII